MVVQIHPLLFAPVAQQDERLASDQEDVGSSPAGGAIFLAAVVEWKHASPSPRRMRVQFPPAVQGTSGTAVARADIAGVGGSTTLVHYGHVGEWSPCLVVNQENTGSNPVMPACCRRGGSGRRTTMRM